MTEKKVSQSTETKNIVEIIKQSEKYLFSTPGQPPDAQGYCHGVEKTAIVNKDTNKIHTLGKVHNQSVI